MKTKQYITNHIKNLRKQNDISDSDVDILKNIKITNVKTVIDLKPKIKNIYKDIIPKPLYNGLDYFIEKIFEKELSQLTNDQQKGVKLLIEFLYNSKLVFGLYGYAGTGKTTTIIELLYMLLNMGLIKALAVTAPTNKATDIIRAKFKRYIDLLCIEDLSFDDKLDWLKKNKNINIEIITIHKLLNYNNDFNSEGNRIFVKRGKSNISKYDIVIIDECSMIPSRIVNDIFDEIRKSKSMTKTIFIGDPAQLPPVNETNSIIFSNNKDCIYKTLLPQLKEQDEAVIVVTEDSVTNKMEMLHEDIKETNSYTLSKVVRSDKSNIINLSNSIREWVLGKIKLPDITQFKGNGVFLYRKEKDKTNTSWFKKFIKYSQEGSNSIILAWRNIQCDKYNARFREEMFNKNKLDRFVKGDVLIINDFYNMDEIKSNKSTKFYTSEQVRINDVEEIELKINGISDKSFRTLKDANIKQKVNDVIDKINDATLREYTIYKLYVSKLGENILSETTCINVLHKKSEKDLEYDKEVSAEEIKKLRDFFKKRFPTRLKTLDRDVIKYLWRERDKTFISSFCNVNYGASISCHKSQASTYHNVFVDADDILMNDNYEECKRCIYTAITRTSNEVHIML